MAKNILVADEDIDTRIILRALLERNGFSVVDAASPEAAVDAAQAREVDLVILNHPMRNARGTALIEVLRNIEKTRTVPIVNLSSRVVPRMFEEAAALGVTRSIAKPINVEEVLAVVRELVTPIAYAS
jgi:CheY-like chemotaxis protein